MMSRGQIMGVKYQIAEN